MSVPGKKEKEENAEVTPMRPTREEYSSNFFQNLYSDTKNFLGNQFPFGGPLIDRANLEIDKKAYPKKYFGTMDEQGKKSNTDNGIKVEQLTNDNNISNSETTLTPEKRSSNFKQTADMGRSFDLTGETNISNGGKQFVFGKGRSSGMNLSIDNSISNLGKNLQQNMDLDSKFDKTNNNVSSKTRGGLFGNYGKKVEIRKTFDESTGRTNKQKFIDGELASDRNARQDVRRKGKSSEARAKRKAGRNK